MSHLQSPLPSGLNQLFEQAARRVKAENAFGEVSIRSDVLDCQAKASAAPAIYRLSFESGRLWASLVTLDRWLSQSIEADLVHTGDKLEELLSEELVDLGYVGPAPGFEHFRSEDKLFTFRSVVPLDLAKLAEPKAAETAAIFLLGYEACFRRLGDMDTVEE